MLVNFFIAAGILFVISISWFLVHYWMNPIMTQPDGKGRLKGSCGDIMEIYLKFHHNKAVDISHWTNGCSYSFTCLQFASDLAKNKQPEEILDIRAEDIANLIGGLPKDHMHCATLAASTLHSAVDDYMKSNTKKI